MPGWSTDCRGCHQRDAPHHLLGQRPGGPPHPATTTGRVNTNGRIMAVDPSATNAYVLTASGLSIIPLTPASASAPQVTGVGNPPISGAHRTCGLVAIFGKNLASTASVSAPLPTTLGGACVTVNNSPIPLMATSPSQINAQVPVTTLAGNVSHGDSLDCESGRLRAASTSRFPNTHRPSSWMRRAPRSSIRTAAREQAQSRHSRRRTHHLRYRIRSHHRRQSHPGQCSLQPAGGTGPIAVYFGDPTAAIPA